MTDTQTDYTNELKRNGFVFLNRFNTKHTEHKTGKLLSKIDAEET